MVVATGRKESPEEWEARQKKELDEAINKLPACDAARYVQQRLDCKIGPYLEKWGKRSWRELLTLKREAEVPEELLKVMLKIMEIVEAYDNIESYSIETDSMRKQMEIQKSLMKLVHPKGKQVEEVANLMVKAIHVKENTEERLMRSKEEAEEGLDLLRLRPHIIQELRDGLRKVFKDELK